MNLHAEKIPEEIKEEVLRVVRRVEANKIRAEREDIKYLFDIYHEYISPYDKQNIDCRACRAKVCGIFFTILYEWTK